MQVVPDIICRLEEKCQNGADTVTLDTRLVAAAVEGLKLVSDLEKQLAEANELLSLKPTLAKKLNDKIKSLQVEIEVLRSDTKVNELERKVQRLETELKQSYATKNFTLKSGLLDIEKNYREFIYASADVEELWSEIMLLLDEQRDPSLPSASSMRRPRVPGETRASPSLRHMRTPGGAAEAGLHPGTIAEELDDEHVVQVQEQVAKIQEFGVDSGPLFCPTEVGPAPHRPAAAHGPLLEPDARYSDVLPDRTSLEHESGVQGVRERYAGPGVSEPGQPYTRPPRPSYFKAAGPVDASALHNQAEIMSACVSQLRLLFAAAGSLLPGGSGHTHGSGGAAASSGRVPDASYWDEQVEDLQWSIQELMDLYAGMAGYGDEQRLSGGGDAPSASGLPVGPPDASYFSSQAEAVLNSIQHLRQLYQQQQQQAAAPGSPEEAAAAAAAGYQLPDASSSSSSFEVQAQQLESSVLSLRATFADEGMTPLQMAGSGGGGAPGSGGSRRIRFASAASAARAGSGSLGFDPLLVPSEPLIALFTSFMAHISSQGAYPSSSRKQQQRQRSADGQQQQQQGADEQQQQKQQEAAPSAYELTSLFQKYLRTPGGPPGLTFSHKEALLMASQEFGGTAAASLAGGADLAASWQHLEVLQQELEARHREALAAHPAAAALWEDAKKLNAVALEAGAAAAAGAAAPAAAGSSNNGVSLRIALDGQAGEPAAGTTGQIVTESSQLYNDGGDSAAGAGGAAARPGAYIGGSVGTSARHGSAAAAAASQAEAMEGTYEGRGTLSAGIAAYAGRNVEASALRDSDGAAAGQTEGAMETYAGSDNLSAAVGLLPAFEAAAAADDVEGAVQLQEGARNTVMGAECGEGSVVAAAAPSAEGEEAAAAAGEAGDTGEEADSSPRHAAASADAQTGEEGLGRPAGSQQPPPSPLSVVLHEDREQVMDELRRLNVDYAERLAEQNMAMTAATRQQRQAEQFAKDLQVRLGSLASEAAALREDNEVLTRLLVETKVLCAEKESENMHLQQRLKRSLKYENNFRDENEDLKLKLQEAEEDLIDLSGPPLSGDVPPAAKARKERSHPSVEPGRRLGAPMQSV